MQRIALILTYFGPFPDWFSLWLHTASRNETIDFFVFTDNCDIYSHGDNVHFVPYSLEEFKTSLSEKVGYNVCLDSPYKICDYKPAYGLLFHEWIKGFDFWGWCDPDVIWGNLREFLTDEVLSSYDRFFELGHLSVFRNEERINSLFLDWKAPVNYTFYEASHLKSHIGFDEISGFLPLQRLQAKEGKLSIYNDIKSIGDIFCDELCYSTYWADASTSPHIYGYQNGELFALIANENNVQVKPMVYVHIQKRKMHIKIQDFSAFLIKENDFIPWREVNAALICEYNSDHTYIYEEKRSSIFELYTMRNFMYRGLVRYCRRLLVKRTQRARWMQSGQLCNLMGQR